MDVVNAFMFYSIIISEATYDFLPGDNEDLFNEIKFNWLSLELENHCLIKTSEMWFMWFVD